jgi:hypothetical protein
MIKYAFGKETMSRTETFDWFSKFENGVMSANNAECPGYLAMSKMNDNLMRIKKLIHEIRVVTIRDFTDEVRILYGSC